MQLHDIPGNKKQKKRVGRGGKRGTYSGRGIKGQKARSGRRIRPQVRDVLKKIPKKRGYRFTAFRARPLTVSLSILEKIYRNGEVVSPQTLAQKGVIKRRAGENAAVKILANGEITKKLTVENCELSASAKEKIEKAGGNIKGKS